MRIVFLLSNFVFACLPFITNAQVAEKDHTGLSVQVEAGFAKFHLKEEQYSSKVLSGVDWGACISMKRKADLDRQVIQFGVMQGKVVSPNGDLYKQNRNIFYGMFGSSWRLLGTKNGISLFGGLATSFMLNRRKYPLYVNFQSTGEDAIDIGPLVEVEWRVIPSLPVHLNTTLYVNLYAAVRQQPFGGSVNDATEKQKWQIVNISAWKQAQFRSQLSWEISDKSESGLLYQGNWFKTGGDIKVNSFSNRLSVFYNYYLRAK